MHGSAKSKNNGIHGYIFMISCGVLLGAFIELIYHERVIFAASVIMGTYFAIIHKINHSLTGEPIFTRALTATFSITAVELVFGAITNRVMHLHLWDFSDSLFHVMGQICVREFLIRFIIALPAIYLSKTADLIPILRRTSDG